MTGSDTPLSGLQDRNAVGTPVAPSSSLITLEFPCHCELGNTDLASGRGSKESYTLDLQATELRQIMSPQDQSERTGLPYSSPVTATTGKPRQEAAAVCHSVPATGLSSRLVLFQHSLSGATRVFVRRPGGVTSDVFGRSQRSALTGFKNDENPLVHETTELAAAVLGVQASLANQI
ncbi:hypothetical protein TREES_T100020965 [Tupaia chinensis]|uniref:Uncharacterized protein n=1 Tax=Tupaia chinensis TaxID=246437 RepID=L9JE64_TUPCH|nr:hypothetical protein TREES_T100020965 [Tupaia chinensis]